MNLSLLQSPRQHWCKRCIVHCHMSIAFRNRTLRRKRILRQHNSSEMLRADRHGRIFRRFDRDSQIHHPIGDWEECTCHSDSETLAPHRIRSARLESRVRRLHHHPGHSRRHHCRSVANRDTTKPFWHEMPTKHVTYWMLMSSTTRRFLSWDPIFKKVCKSEFVSIIRQRSEFVLTLCHRIVVEASICSRMHCRDVVALRQDIWNRIRSFSSVHSTWTDLRRRRSWTWVVERRDFVLAHGCCRSAIIR